MILEIIAEANPVQTISVPISYIISFVGFVITVFLIPYIVWSFRNSRTQQKAIDSLKQKNISDDKSLEQYKEYKQEKEEIFQQLVTKLDGQIEKFTDKVSDQIERFTDKVSDQMKTIDTRVSKIEGKVGIK